MKRSRWRHFRSWWFITIVVLALIVTSIVWASRGSGAPTFDATAAVRGNVIETVGVTGSISPFDKADLAFQKGGVVSEIGVRVGDKVTRGQVIARLDSAGDAAALDSARATLADMSRTLSAEELAVQKTLLDNARRDAVNAARSGLVKAQNAVFNDADDLFANSQSANPTITVRVSSQPRETAINNQRFSVSVLLNKWANELANSSETNPADIISMAQEHLSSVKSFLDTLSVIVSELSTGNSGLTQSQINAHISTMNTALSTINSAIDGITAAETALAATQTNYNLNLAGNSSQSIAAQAAKVAQAQAALDQDTMTSPIDGIVTKVTPSVGEYIGAGQAGFTIQNDELKIEAYVPEADIAKISVGDFASTTLDAYGSAVDFPAQVFMVDPAETVLEGVPTYKVTLVFLSSDSRIRSGMTANLDIITDARYGVVAVPYRAIMDGDMGGKAVRVVSADGLTYSNVSVTTGLRGSSGTIEILSGISEGDKVVTYVK